MLSLLIHLFRLTIISAIVTTVASNESDDRCRLPQPRSPSCTSMVPPETAAAGLGMYYQYPCEEVGCNFHRPYCRLCAVHPFMINHPYPECPPCVKPISEISKSISNDDKCSLPNKDSCTSNTPPGVTRAGLGVFYQYPCHEVGCNFFRPFCRLCTKDPSKINQPYPPCPKCVV